KPARSADWARAFVLAQLSWNVPSAVEATVRLLQLVQKVPSFIRLSLNSGFVDCPVWFAGVLTSAIELTLLFGVSAAPGPARSGSERSALELPLVDVPRGVLRRHVGQPIVQQDRAHVVEQPHRVQLIGQVM